MTTTRWLRLLCLCLSWWATHSLAVGLDATGKQTQRVPTLDQVQVFEDVSGKMRLDDILTLSAGATQGFLPMQRSRLKPGFTHSAWWLHVSVSNHSSTALPLVLVLPDARLENVDFYTERSGHWTHDRSDPTSLASQPFSSRYPLADFTLAPGEQRLFLIRVASDTAITLEPRLYSAAAYDALEKRAALWDGGLIGGTLALAWCALLIAYFSRSVSFLVLTALCAMTALFEAADRGYTKLYLWPFATEWSARSVTVLGCTAVLLFIVFILRISHSEKANLPARYILFGFALLECVAAIGAAFGNLFVFAQVGVYVNALFGVFTVIIAARLARQSTPTARIMLLVMIFSLFSFALRMLETLGSLPTALAWLKSDIHPNPVVAIIGLATNLIVLAAWINHVGKQRIAARTELADWQRSEHERLRDQVAQRTLELNEALLYAEEKNQQLIETLGYVSHDLRAPLATITGYARQLRDLADSKQVRPIQAIERSVNYQLGLIDELVGYAKTELQPLDIAPVATNLPALLDDIAEYALALCAQLNNQFNYQALTSLPRRLTIDGRRLQQVLLNLLSNASKFTRDGFVTMTVSARLQDDQWHMSFEVADTGIGIDIEAQSKLFTAFRQIQAVNGSTGLGLIIAQRIVNTMGGDLRVSSAPQRGTSFSFGLIAPITEDTDASPSNVAQYSSGGSAHIRPQRKHGFAVSAPPESDRQELAVLAKDGRLTDIERWIENMIRIHPSCAAFLTEMRRCLEALDFAGIEALALAPHETNDVSRPW
ncbi:MULTISPECIES: sensor histidine kinase [Paraburkholderia]|uniref:histidine kinase n=1 Tax=Paraburkholderia madseniana TaxID=2599607 RepID=A0A6N6W9B1_9BURK|nr:MULTISPECIES: sensor histidine kinase [Paraburkholderia]KAE8756478.1 histidine kinase [Paraburkholderia madseniana]MCX4146373.1 sensor histidine kinase [Paraburkholderia madseniana]MDN7149319.1 sensor histidine kinase [Paraburkholderia sp. WS6]MDQ6408199.1 sensor histidine kinase [Paraburkholderia madseniana]